MCHELRFCGHRAAVVNTLRPLDSGRGSGKKDVSIFGLGSIIFLKLQVLLVTPLNRRLRPGALLAATLPPADLLKKYRQSRIGSGTGAYVDTGDIELAAQVAPQNRFQKHTVWDITRFLRFTRYIKDVRFAAIAGHAAVKALYPGRSKAPSLRPIQSMSAKSHCPRTFCQGRPLHQWPHGRAKGFPAKPH